MSLHVSYLRALLSQPRIILNMGFSGEGTAHIQAVLHKARMGRFADSQVMRPTADAQGYETIAMADMPTLVNRIRYDDTKRRDLINLVGHMD
jgi:hypothetical protein